jgi:hypothetical protein
VEYREGRGKEGAEGRKNPGRKETRIEGRSIANIMGLHSIQIT